MTGPMTWEGFTAALTDVLGRLPDGVLLKLHEVSRPIGGYYAQIWQNPDRLYAELASNIGLDPDRQLSVERQNRFRELGWLPLNDDPDLNWRMEVDWPGSAADYAHLAASLVTGFRDVFGLRAPTDLAYQSDRNTDGRGEWFPLPELGLETIRIRHYARLGPGDTPERPKGLLRRFRIGSVDRDEALGRDGRWRPTETLELADLGELDDELVPLRPLEVDRVTRWWRTLVEQAAVDARLPPGTPRMRLAASVDTVRDPSGPAELPAARLDEWERSAVAGYLRNAPLVAVAYGFDADPFDPDRAEVVPLNFHTDGQWVWSESLAYFADRYGIPPEPDFLRHMARRRYQLSDVDDESLGRAVKLIRRL